MSRPEGDDFYYRAKPAAALVRRQNLSLEARGAADTYEKQMHTRDGTLPDEHDAKGMAWHLSALGVRNSRTVHRLLKALLELGELVRLGDGRLTSPEVQRELAHRARKRDVKGGGGGGQAPPARQLVLIEGGRSPPPPVDQAVNGTGIVDESVGNRDLETRFPPERGRKAQPNQRAGLSSRVRDTHDVVVVIGTVPPRARDGPAALRA